MELLEYQAKKLFGEVGIPILPSQTVNNSRELKGLQIPYPVVLKSQVRAGGRSKVGGIRFVENTIDAIAAARSIFNLPILGEYPQVLMAEARYNPQQEVFLAVVLDYQLKRPVLLGSAQGGINIDVLLEQMQTVVVEEQFSPFYARRLAIKMGLKGVLISSVSTIIEKMYLLFTDKDLDIIEINPLGVNADGEVMALDGKITINDYALERHPEVITLSTLEEKSTVESEDNSLAVACKLPQPRFLEWDREKGNVAVICNSVLLAQAIGDLITQEKGKLCCCLVIRQSFAGKLLPPSSLTAQTEQAIEQALAINQIKTLLINVIGDSQTVQTVAEAIANYWQPQVGEAASASEERKSRETASASNSRRQRSQSSTEPTESNKQWVVRLVGTETDTVQERLASVPVHWTDSLETAVTKTVSLTGVKK